ncbi:Mu transposase C-terminal domain-containing protein [uncultured Herbaspirillum sp.]|uniref:Mu transposase C-terminal domain-containing protein n=1 Tax=uncultured Herbaspirillum sp. TaxID=160236 RepID=UPI002585EDB4|nr:Mu transposase C-terminal domain-containing protein [uncultured Herbaspirillum sp.]
MSYFLGKGLLIEQEKIIYEYLHRSGHRIHFKEVQTSDIITIEEDDFHLKRENGEIKILCARASDTEIETSEESVHPDVSAFSEKVQASALRAYSYVRGIQQRGITRGVLHLIEEAIEEISLEISDLSPPSSRTVSSWAEKYEKSQGDLFSLLDKRACKRVAKRNSAENERLIQESIEAIWMNLKRRDIRQTYQAYLDAIRIENDRLGKIGIARMECVSERTFYRRVAEVHKRDAAIARFGRAHANNEFRMIKGHLPAKRPLDYVEIDSTILDLYIVDDNLNLPLGRPTLYVLKDRYSGMVLGFFASFSGPSAEGALTAIANSFKPRSEIKRRFPSIKNDWPVAGPATVYVTDNGPDFQSLAFRRGIAELGSIQSRCEVRTPWHKPSVESFFNVLNGSLLEAMPGKTFSHVLKRFGYDPVRDAVVRFSVFVELLYKWAIDYHNQRPHSRKHLSPNQQWIEAMKELPLPLPPDPRSINLMIGETRTAKPSHEGIRCENLNYSSPELIDLYHQARPQKIEFKISRQDLGRIYVLDPRHRRYIEVQCTRMDYAHGLSLTQHKMISKFNREKGRASNSTEELIASKKELTEILTEDIGRNKRANLKASRYAGISSENVLDGRNTSISVIREEKVRGAEEPDVDVLFDAISAYPAIFKQRGT